MQRIVLLLDMDAFYASIEQRDNPSLQGKPVIVISPPPTSVVATASREARKDNVESGQPLHEAKRLCPNGKFIVARDDVYQKESEMIMSRLADIILHEPMETKGRDEAYLDVTSLCKMETEAASWKQALVLGDVLRKIIRREYRLPCTVGIASNKALAKLASDDAKPDGLKLIRDDEKIDYLRPRPLKKLPGIGKFKMGVLDDAGFKTIGDVQDSTVDFVGLFGKKLGRPLAANLIKLAMGEDDEPVHQQPRKEINKRHTFRPNETDLTILKRWLKKLAEDVEIVITQLKVNPMSVHVNVSYRFPKNTCRTKTLSEPVYKSAEIYEIGLRLLIDNNLLCEPIRMISIGVSRWKTNTDQIPKSEKMML